MKIENFPMLPSVWLHFSFKKGTFTCEAIYTARGLIRSLISQAKSVYRSHSQMLTPTAVCSHVHNHNNHKLNKLATEYMYNFNTAHILYSGPMELHVGKFSHLEELHILVFIVLKSSHF